MHIHINPADMRRRASTACPTVADLVSWITTFSSLRIPRTSVCPHHNAPFDYVRLAYFEPARDLVVWAPRGGGKTRLGALATLLDLLHKPGCSVRILGGSLEQSLRMWEHLLPDLENAGAHVISPTRTRHRATLRTGSSVAVLAQSQRAVRGQRVQKLRCDEVELFKPEIWQAAQLVTRSRTIVRGSRTVPVAGAIEALSTLHSPFGLMHQIIEGAEQAQKTVLRWCILDVLEQCPPERECASCPLWDDCRGVAKTRCAGFVTIDDAIRLKQRSSREMWETEMLCLRPSVRECVFPTFDRDVHARETIDAAPARNEPAMTLALDFGFAAPFVCLWVAEHDDATIHVLDEYVQPQRTMEEHLGYIEQRQWGFVRRIACDPAGAGRNEQTAKSNLDLLRSRGYRVKTRRSRIVDGIELIRHALKPASGRPTLFVHPRCVRLVKAMESYRYAPGGSELPVKDGEHDHLIDALRYFFVNRGAGVVRVREY